MPLLLYSPVYDEVTKVLHEWAEKLASEVPGVQLCSDWRCFTSMLGEYGRVSVWCHGEPNAIIVESGAVLACNNDYIFADHDVYLLSCLSGLQLAPSMVGKGANSVIAFIRSVAVYVGLGDIFYRVLSMPARLLAAGVDPMEAYVRSIEYGAKVLIETYGRIPDVVWSALHSDVTSMVFYAREEGEVKTITWVQALDMVSSAIANQIRMSASLAASIASLSLAYALASRW